jgi:hypothetical protein
MSIFFPTPHISSRIGSEVMNTIYNASTLEDVAVQIVRKHLAVGRNIVGKEHLFDRSRPKRLSDVIENLGQDTWSFALISALCSCLSASLLESKSLPFLLLVSCQDEQAFPRPRTVVIR